MAFKYENEFMINYLKKFMFAGFSGNLAASLYWLWIPCAKAYFVGSPGVMVAPVYAAWYLFNFAFFLAGIVIIELIEKNYQVL